MIKDLIKFMIAMAVADILKVFIYSLGFFNFSHAPLFSLNSFYDMTIFVLCYIPAEFMTGKIVARRSIK